MSTITVTIPSPGGTATIVDTTAEAILAQTTALEAAFFTLQSELAFIDGNLTTLNANIVTLTTAFNNSLGLPGVAIPTTPANSMNRSATLLAEIGKLLIDIEKSIKSSTSSTSIIAYAVAGVSSAASEANAISQMALADQIKKNAFEKAATKEALARAGLPEPTPPPVTDLIKENVADATIINASTEAVSFVETNIRKAILYVGQVAGSYVSLASVGTFAANKWAAFYDYVFARPDEVAKQEITVGLLDATKGGTPLPPTA